MILCVAGVSVCMLLVSIRAHMPMSSCEFMQDCKTEMLHAHNGTLGVWNLFLSPVFPYVNSM